MEIQLKRFDIREIKDDKVVVLIGKRDTGKSYLCKDILSHHTGKTYKEIEKDSDRDKWMRSEEAKEYGIIDEVLIKKS